MRRYSFGFTRAVERFLHQPSVAFQRLRAIAITSITLSVLAGGMPQAFAQENNCMQDNWHASGKTQNLTCNAKEVFIDEDPATQEKLIEIDIVEPCTYPGDTTTVDITASIHFNSDRLDVGVYSALDGGDALTGSCAVDILDPINTADIVDGPGSAIVVGTTGSFDTKPADDPHDACGDVQIDGGGGGNLDEFQFQRLELKCIDEDLDGLLDFSTCFSWRVPGTDDSCDGSQSDVYPGSPSKCFCESFNIEVPVPGQIIVVKELDPPDLGSPFSDTTFDFTLSGGTSSIDGQPLDEGFSLKGGETFDTADAVPPMPGTYAVTETEPEGWDLIDAACDDGSDPLAIQLDENETVTCTFTNRIALGNIIVKKVTDPATAETADVVFTFESSYSGEFTLKHGEENDSGPLLPGTYSVGEIVPAGWTLDSATCDDGSPVSAIELDPGENVTCTFVNEQQGKIIVEKQTDPAGHAQVFDFTASYDGAGFSLSDGERNESGYLAPGTYSVDEDVPAGWILASTVCSDGSTKGAIDLGAGETVTCTFNNELQRGGITVVKETIPADSMQEFTFEADYQADFTLADGQSNASGDLLPGTYSVGEIVPAGWTLDSATCDDGSPVSAIELDPGENVTCTFVNEQQGKIIVEKQTDPAGHAQVFDFTASYDGAGFSLSDGKRNESGYLAPGVYSVAETGIPTNWALSDSWCTEENEPAVQFSPDNIVLAAGDSVHCLFINIDTIVKSEPGFIKIVKQTRPAYDPATTDHVFSFTLTGGLDDANRDALDEAFYLENGEEYISVAVRPSNDGGTFEVAESLPDGWDQESATCDRGTPDAIEVLTNLTTTCTFVNVQRGMAGVLKTVLGSPPVGDHSFTFQLREGASASEIGTILSSLDANAANGGDIVFDIKLLPGAEYQLCEVVAPGWSTNLGALATGFFTPPDGHVVTPGIDSSIACIVFTVGAGETKIFEVDNTPLPGGNARTIGFWGEWSSCDGMGNQDPELDRALAAAEPVGVTLGDLTLHGDSANPDVSPDCSDAIAILRKRDIDSSRKRASDPAFNLASQLLAAKLNLAAGADFCPKLSDAVIAADQLLSDISFDGTGSSILRMTGLKSEALRLATILDNYNNNLLCYF